MKITRRRDVSQHQRKITSNSHHVIQERSEGLSDIKAISPCAIAHENKALESLVEPVVELINDVGHALAFQLPDAELDRAVAASARATALDLYRLRVVAVYRRNVLASLELLVFTIALNEIIQFLV